MKYHADEQFKEVSRKLVLSTEIRVERRVRPWAAGTFLLCPAVFFSPRLLVGRGALHRDQVSDRRN